MKKPYLILSFFIFLSTSVFCQKSGKNDISFGVLSQGEFYFFTGLKQFYLFGDYRYSHKNFFTRLRVSYFNNPYGSTVDDFVGSYGTEPVTYLWLEAAHAQDFQFKDQIALKPKTGIKTYKQSAIYYTNISFNLWLGYNFKIGAQKRFQIEPSFGYTAYYFRNDVVWLTTDIQLGDDKPNPSLPRKRIMIYNTTRGIVWGPEGDLTFRYYFPKHYSAGFNVIGGSNKYFNTFYVGCFIGFNF